jgi:ribosomal peptide maturation radical SAM protein 1
MCKVCLIDMPFANVRFPSIALTQLASLVRAKLGNKVSVEVIYISHDFAKFTGVDLYQYISQSIEPLYAGLGDWFFREVAFPDLPDNTEKYLRRFYWAKGKQTQQVKNLIAEKRPILNQYMDDLIGKYKLDEADIIGFTSMFMQNGAAFAMSRKIKQRNPKVITVMGGANCEFPMGKVIAERIKEIDFVFSGPALKNFPEFVEACIEGDAQKCNSLPGIFRNGVPLPEGAESVGEELSLDVTIDLDYNDFLARFSQYFTEKEVHAILPFETSRGCWWGQRAHCTFCGLNGLSMSYRAMRPDIAVKQFQSLFRYSGKVRMLQAVDNILPKSYLTEVLPQIETPANMSIFYEVKADLSEPEIAALSKARITNIQPGIESLATSTLKLMKKGTTAFQNVNFLKMCALYAVTPAWNLLIGFPGEGADVYRRYLEIVPLLTHLYPPSGVYPVRFDRFSPYHYKAKEYGLDLQPMSFYSLVYPFNEKELNDFAYYFSDRNFLAEYAKVATEWLSRLQSVVSKWQSRWKPKMPELAPRLYLKEEQDVVYDSRSDSVIEHRLCDREKSILKHLARPVRLDDLMAVFSRDGIDVTPELQLLQQKKLIFQENDRLLSLVLDGDYGSKAATRRAELIAQKEPAVV